MRVVTFDSGHGPALGVSLDDGDVVDAQQAWIALEGQPLPAFFSVQAWLDGGETADQQLRRAVIAAPEGAVIPHNAVQLLAPLPRPPSIRDCLTFEAHVLNSTRRFGPPWFHAFDTALARVVGSRRSIAGRLNRTFYARPIYYKTNIRSVVGPNADIRMPEYEHAAFDYELEWAAVIGRTGANIPLREASAYIAGYTIFNDFSCRSVQLEELSGRLGPAKAKDFDTGNALGPWLTTSDEVTDPYTLTMRAKVNGAEWSRGTMADMRWTFEELIAYISRSETLYPGDVIASGTCSGKQGVGCGLEHGAYLRAGDVVELEVSGIGILRNRVVDGDWLLRRQLAVHEQLP